MIISNQIEHLKNLYKELKYAEVIQFGTITLPFSLEEKRYDDALVCYEYIASAYFETGNLESFLVMMNDYEKLCLTYGKDQNKMIFYYLLSLLNVMFGKHDESIEASKKSIKYAHYLKRNELIVINYYNISAQFAHTDQIEKAGMAMCLANYYKREMPYLNPTIVRGYLGALYYFAVTRNNDEFQKNKQDFSERLKGKYSFYHGNMLIAEAILKFNLGYVQESVSFFGGH
ncbi:hypothetical protein ACTHOQ_18090 [Solibacillus silvestris]|uniref:hypothetical protein n=1 Tax=Solibacillus silvestris TaxID=76853 RepID=UPI003F800D8B